MGLMFENTFFFFLQFYIYIYFILKIDNASCQDLILDYRESYFLIALGCVSSTLMLLYDIYFIMNFREFNIKIALFFLNVHTLTRLNENKTMDGSRGRGLRT